MSAPGPRALVRRVLAALLLGWAFGAGAGLAAADTVVVLVRHAEKATDHPKDPALSEAGQARAASLAKVLADYPLASALVSEYKRTGQTAGPTLRQHNLTATILPVGKDTAEAYGQRMAELVRRKHQGEALLVVSHSDTVPAILFALAGVQVPPILEASEFNRLYVITLPAQGRPGVIAARF